jgi:hypothetical protein
VHGDLLLDGRGTVAYISPGLKENTPTLATVQFDMGGTDRDWFFWDDVIISGNMSAGSKNFIIPHPLDEENRVLIHTCIESPKAGLHYSGKVKLDKGEATVLIDIESCPESPMTEGTFEALTRNPRVHLQNNDNFDRVKGRVIGGTLEIECENNKSSAEICWLVIAERKDNTITQSRTTNEKGHLITEDRKGKWLLKDDDRPSKKKEKREKEEKEK